MPSATIPAATPDGVIAPARSAFLSGGGACADLIAATDWTSTSAGPPAHWPSCLKATVAIMLRARVPMAMLWGRDGILLYNDAYAALAGAHPPAPFGTAIRDAGPGAAGFDEQVVQAVLAGRTLRCHDRQLTRQRDGRAEQVWMDLDYSPVLDEDGVPAGVLCILADTTGRVAAEHRAGFLLSLSDEFRLLRTPAEIMALAAERVGERMGASRVFYAEITTRGWMTVERDYARGVASIIGVHSLESFGPDLLAAYRAGAPVVVRDVGGDERLSEGARCGLQAREVGAFVDVVLFQEEEWVGLLAVQNATPRDWTPAEESLIQEVGERVKAAVERARAEVALHEMKDTLERLVADRTAELRRYHAIVDATAAPICAFDTAHRLIAFNRAHNDEFRRVNGFDTRIGDVFPDQFIPEQAITMRANMDRALAGETFTVVAAFGRPEYGQPAWEISYTPLRDAAGEVIGAFHQATDISARLTAEAELEIAQDALRQSQKMEAMGSLTGGVAHDFNNLLTPIIGSLDLLMRKGVGDVRERRLIDGALQSAERAKTLVQRLLAFARRQPLQPTAVDLGLLVASMTDLVESTLGPTIALHLDLAPGLPLARADANQLEMALLNLAVNARDAMTDGGELTIAVAHRCCGEGDAAGLAAGHYVGLTVRDTGHGMDDATRLRAIEPFFSTKGVGKGTGLGLSMVHGLAAQLGGGLAIDSAPGCGTAITLWLPISTLPAPHPDTVADAIPLAPLARGTVLLVEDEELVRMSTADMLIDLGYAVAEACSGQEAIELVRAGLRPDLLVTDHLMPGITGAQLARTLRDDLPGLPTLIVSGYAEADGIAPDLPRLTKPFRNTELAASLSALVASSTARA
ncbi:GAF domain-containing hybrid sensor histidine kinase/response regulator [Sphingomonas adhaesiva]|uniref:GAF domain-containing hybrid sensor histidine kinase/response regulator n=1 Tax=Sphingomonas adhaesiva TaxID=28212 RepID=UPI002FFC0757